MGRASDLTIRGVFLPWSDWNIEGPPYVDLPLEERAQLVFSTLFGKGPLGARAVGLSGAGGLLVDKPKVTPKTQSVTHGVNTLVFPSAGNGLQNVLAVLLIAVQGTGVSPSQAAPVVFTILDGSTTILTLNFPAFTPSGVVPTFPLTVLSDCGIASSPNSALTLNLTDPGASNFTTINAGIYQA